MDQILVGPATEEQLARWSEKYGITDEEFTVTPEGKAMATQQEILENVAINALRHDIPNLEPNEYTPKIMVYVGGGPTLKQFLPEIKAKCEDGRYDVYTSNKTAAYLVENGVIPNYHIIIDPQESKVRDLDYEADVPLILGLQCHPALFEKAGGKKVKKFLATSVMDYEGRSDLSIATEACRPGDKMLCISGGSMTGTRMLFLAPALGHRTLEYYGFDGHVDLHDGKVEYYAYFKNRGEAIIETTAGNGRVFSTTMTFLKQAEELADLLDIMPGLDVTIHGDSLMSNQLKIYRENRPQIKERITPEYLEMQRSYHKSVRYYGTEGKKHAPKMFMTAAQYAKKFGGCSVLDYGCGPGTLLTTIKDVFPEINGVSYAEYDPCYPGKDERPLPADIVFCGDVLEHIEPQCIDAVIGDLASLTKRLLIACIATEPAKKTLPDGRNAHLSVHHHEWWLSKLRRHFVVHEYQVMPDHIIAALGKMG
jgi:hypothetical protein